MTKLKDVPEAVQLFKTSRYKIKVITVIAFRFPKEIQVRVIADITHASPVVIEAPARIKAQQI